MTYYTRLMIFEVLQQFELLKTKKEKLKHLRTHDSPALRDMIRCSLDPKIQFLLPEGAPPYNPAATSSIPSNLLRQNVKLTYWVKGSPKAEQVDKIRRERIFMDVLESIHPEDALVLINAKEKKQLAKGLTVKFVNEAFPGLIA